MNNEIFKTISLQDLYTMMQSYKEAFISLFSGDESTGLCATIPIKSLRLFQHSTKAPTLLSSGSSAFVLQAASVKVSAPSFSRDSCSFTLASAGVQYKIVLL